MNAADPAIRALTSQRGHIVETTMEVLVPGYPRRRRIRDLEAGIGEAFDVIIGCSVEQRRLTENDLAFLRPVVRNALFRGGTEAEILHAPLTFFRIMWNAVVKAVGGTVEGDRSIVRLTPTMLEYVETASRISHEVHLVVSEARNSLSSVARFELVTRLIGGMMPETGVQLSLARRSGLSRETPIQVMVARSGDENASEVALPLALRVLTRAAAMGGLEPLSVVREGEIVIVRATPHHEAAALAEVIGEAHEQLVSDGTPLAMATSTVHDGLGAVPAAYHEACLALETLRGRAGLVAISTVGTLDYLVIRAGDSAVWRLVPEPIREFVAAELSGDRVLLDTLLAYVAADLNVRQAAKELYVHPNTAHYRLERIAQRTGCNLRSFGDLQQLVLAIRVGTAGAH